MHCRDLFVVFVSFLPLWSPAKSGMSSPDVSRGLYQEASHTQDKFSVVRLHRTRRQAVLDTMCYTNRLINGQLSNPGVF